MERNHGFENSLRCLGHPLSLVSITLLLLNDNVFKVISPSWLTGKLSDFAGLFFFPFIVAAGLSVSLAIFNFKPRAIGVSAFALVGIWFASLKTIPFVNRLSVESISELLGRPVQLLVDPTDILALLMLYPAWLLWKAESQINKDRVNYAPLLIGLLASLATSPPAPQVEVVTHLLVNDSKILAVDLWSGTAAISRDGGKTWEWDWETEFESLPVDPRSLPIEICSAQISGRCFRINGEGIVEESKNGGVDWEISWQQPPERIIYLDRLDHDIDVGPYDLILVVFEDHEYILAAAGEEGVLRRDLPYGDWERIPVENAKPTPYYAQNLSSVFAVIWREVLVWFLLSLMLFVVACGWVWKVNSEVSEERLSILKWIIWPSLSPLAGLVGTLSVQVIIAVVALFAGQIAVFILPFDLIPLLLIVGIGALLAAFAMWPITVARELTHWKQLLTDHQYPPQVSQKIASTAHQSHLWMFLTGLIFWLAWSLGLIPRYEVAMGLAVFCSIVVSVFFVRRIGELSQKNQSGAAPDRQ